MKRVTDKTLINADFDKRIVIRPEDYHWVPSPMPGVERMMLDRIGDEVARATTIVRYQPNSEFSRHTHSGGEEFYVLEGVFSDEHNDYPKGSYVRNPIGTSHTPRVGKEGAVIFVKLHQFALSDTNQSFIDTNDATWESGNIEGVSILPLSKHEDEVVALQRWDPNTRATSHQHFAGEEILVLHGTLYDEHGIYPKGSWIRSPDLSHHAPYTKADGALIYVKTGHLFIEKVDT